MNENRLYLFDTTLRDGQQTPGIDFSVEDKIAIADAARRVRHRLCRGRLSRRQPDRHRLLRREAHGAREIRRLRHDQARRRLGLQRSRPRGARAGEVGRDLLRRQELGLSRARRARLHQRGKPRRRSAPRSRRRRAPARKRWSTASISSTASRPIRTMRWPARKAAYDAGARWVVLCDTNGGTQPSEVRAIVARRHRRRASRAKISASTRMTTPARRSPIRWPRSRPACARSRAR